MSAGNVAEQMEHLACFMAGTVRPFRFMVHFHTRLTWRCVDAQLVLAAEGERTERYMAYAEQLADTCYEARIDLLSFAYFHSR